MSTAGFAPLFDISGRTVLITGGSGVLCRSLAAYLAHSGANVALTSRTRERANALAAQIEAAGGNALGIEADVLDTTCWDGVCATVLERWGRLDVLINGAGGNRPDAGARTELFDPADVDAGLPGLQPEAFADVVALNLTGALAPTQAAVRVMHPNRSGVIINISSMSALRPLTRVAAYSAAKAGLSNFTQWLAVHLAPAGIRVNAIAPGFFLTEQNQYLLKTPDGALTPRGGRILEHTPMQRFGNPEDLHGVAHWLISDASVFVTGAVIPVDGGFNAYAGV